MTSAYLCYLGKHMQCKEGHHDITEFHLECPNELVIHVNNGLIGTQNIFCGNNRECCHEGGCKESVTQHVLSFSQQQCNGHPVCKTQLFTNLSNAFTEECLKKTTNVPIQWQEIKYTCITSPESNKLTFFYV